MAVDLEQQQALSCSSVFVHVAPLYAVGLSEEQHHHASSLVAGAVLRFDGGYSVLELLRAQELLGGDGGLDAHDSTSIAAAMVTTLTPNSLESSTSVSCSPRSLASRHRHLIAATSSALS